ncbi:MAG: discoidin domain-containing protein [Bacteroidota bacterium]|nr:discoidin domain-containing protein [Bacteroidota bacterium]
MKKIKLYVCLLALSAAVACNKKADAILFVDNATAVKANRTGWTITASSEELTGEGAVNGRAAVVVDGNPATYWHSKYVGGAVPFPHWLIIDMKKANKLVTVDLTARLGNNNGFTKFKVEGSVDGTNWVNIGITPTNTTGELTFVPANKTAQAFSVSSVTAYQYIRITALQGPLVTTATTHLAEVDVLIAK